MRQSSTLQTDVSDGNLCESSKATSGRCVKTMDLYATTAIERQNPDRGLDQTPGITPRPFLHNGRHLKGAEAVRFKVS
jgi:hypothetical protein